MEHTDTIKLISDIVLYGWGAALGIYILGYLSLIQLKRASSSAIYSVILAGGLIVALSVFCGMRIDRSILVGSPTFVEMIDLTMTGLLGQLLLATMRFTMNRRVEQQVAERTREAKQKEVLLNTVIDHMPLALFAKDVQQDYRWVIWNRACERFFEMPAGDVIGKLDYDLFPKKEADFFRKTDETVMESRHVVDIPAEPVTTKRGTWTAHTIKVPIYDEQNRPSLLVAILEDITERNAAEEKLREYSAALETHQRALTEAKSRAEAANIAKSEFLANMSHELRTPLNSMLGMLRLVQETELDAAQHELLQIAHASSANLLEIVNDILDLSKIEAGEMTLEHIGIDLNSIFPTVLNTVRHLVQGKPVKLTLEVESLPYVLGDPTRFRQVLTNLIGNAIKYTQQGEVKITANFTRLDTAGILLQCEVSDTGIGIPLEKQKSVFDKFVQADTSTTRRFGGTGLGLAITRQLVKLMGGFIGVKSEPGVGSTFWFRIPFTITDTISDDQQAQQGRQQCGIIPPQQIRILIAEDHPLNQQFIIRMMERFDIPHYQIVENGVLALDAWQKEPWDIILMDCHMPEKNGYETSRTIRRIERQEGMQAHIPIIAMTANAMVGDREKCLQAGMDDYISKPVDHDALKLILSRWIQFPVVTESKPVAPKPTVPKRIISDMPIDLSVLREYSRGDANAEQRIIGIFTKQSEENLGTLMKYCVDGPCASWCDAAHMLKGGAGSIGATMLASLAERAQQMQQSTAQERETMLADLRDEYARVKAHFAAA